MKIKILLRLLLLGIVLVNSGGIANAQQTKKISLQGFLKDANGKALPDGTQAITFKLYTTATGGTAEWTDTQSITIFGGVYSTYLGSIAKPLDALNWATATYYVGVTVQGSELSPRTELTFAPYSLGSPKAQEVVCSGAVGDVKHSYLSPTQFAAVNGSCWVLMDGRSITGSKLATITGQTTVANAGGKFIRCHEMNGSNNDPDRTASSPVASIQASALGSHIHPVTASTISYFDSYPYLIQNSSSSIYDLSYIRDVSLNDNSTSNFVAIGDENYAQSDGLTIGVTMVARPLSLTSISLSSTGHTETRPTNVNLYTYVRIN